MEGLYENDIAVIGMAGRFPKAKDIGEFWKNLVEGVNSMTRADEEEIRASGISNEVLNHKRFVNASSRLEDAKYFDANFFSLSNTESTLMDPQIRLLLQTSWHALEDAGYAVNNLGFPVGNFCGMSTNSYLMKVLRTNSLKESVDPLLYRILNEKDFLATWISYKLGLTGPSMSVQTACSTSLLAVHLACQSLLNRECSIALAGGVSYDAEDRVGYLYTPESINSQDGFCRPFDKDATGTIMGDGVGTIVLKRADEAIKDKDHIYALIKGTATNNDGGNKQGYTTPSVDFQRDVILEALAVSAIHPDTIGMIEAHGTGTVIGDPIEISALTEAFRAYTKKEQYCAIGSVKSNIGHLDAAAGIASIIKTILCVNKGVLVPSINFSIPNPALQLDSSPFYVSQQSTQWPEHFEIRRAGVSSLGVGGSNVHLIVEQAPIIQEASYSKEPYVITLSSLDEKGLNRQKRQLRNYINENQDIRLEDIEFTSLYGRKMLSHRFSLVCNSKDGLISKLKEENHRQCYEGIGDLAESVFLFPGQGSQFANMAANLYSHNQSFKKDMDYCFEYVKSFSNIDFKEIIFTDDHSSLDCTEYTQVSLFIVEYCLAKELSRCGIKASAIVGHSVGEYVAACYVGCISVEDALKLVFHRGKLMGSMSKGAMVQVRAEQNELSPLLLDTLSLCTFNAQDNIVIGGNMEDIEQQCKIFDINKIRYIKLKVSHAYHTHMMQDVLGPFEEILSEVEFKEYDAKIFSTYTGGLVDVNLFSSRQYWLDQIINPVKFLDAIKDVTNYISNPIFIETGPGSGLSSFIRTIFNKQLSTVCMLLKPSNRNGSDDSFYEAKAALYAKGLVFDLPEAHIGKRISMPGYVFSKDYFWKPGISINYDHFDQIKKSYHRMNDRYISDHLKSTVEIHISNNKEISDQLLSSLHHLHSTYINNIKKLFSSEDEMVFNNIEMFYNETSFNKEEDFLLNSKDQNKKRNVNSLFMEPLTDTEHRIAGYWESVLGYFPVGVLDNYFEVGGNSLLATQLMTHLSDEFEMDLSFKELLEAMTIKELAVIIDTKRKMIELVQGIEIGEDNSNNYVE